MNKNAGKIYKNISAKKYTQKALAPQIFGGSGKVRRLPMLADLEKLGSRQCWRIWKN
jgi:hypothetical protein